MVARKQLKNLTEPMYYILLILTTPNHGYGIMQRVEEMTEGHVIIGAGTLYTLLSRFENEGIIKVVSQEDRKKKLCDHGKRQRFVGGRVPATEQTDTGR